ncbi:unnamed protein product [Bursaphelenchus okinawaensis]|uniref:Uncharacterized protein n=1 Tax=Bursaphelenchus okinawaensis TaxID=465554 RepID=A0A811LTQ3_9BILA|nr:unnamed protein product [Bursaphelenchus okinawaensis]CAG9127747.1 unnamed protein product [Bursaphelenchus okinawaensis]
MPRHFPNYNMTISPKKFSTAPNGHRSRLRRVLSSDVFLTPPEAFLNPQPPLPPRRTKRLSLLSWSFVEDRVSTRCSKNSGAGFGFVVAPDL